MILVTPGQWPDDPASALDRYGLPGRSTPLVIASAVDPRAIALATMLSESR